MPVNQDYTRNYMATIYDVAAKAGVSTYTVSAVINRSAYVSPELTARVEQAVTELDYTINHLARSLQTRQTMTVGMLMPDIDNPFYAKAVRGAEDKLREAGYSLLLGNTNNSIDEQTRYLKLFRARQIDGIILVLAAGDQAEVDRAVKSGKPIVFAARLPNMEADSVTADNVGGAEMAVAHLIKKGHKHVAIVTGNKDTSTGNDRIIGWQQALTGQGLQAPPQYIVECDWTTQTAFEATKKFLLSADPRPTAFFVANLLMMIGVVRAIAEAGLKCPQDIEIASCDDADWLEVFQPPITTIAQPAYAIGFEAAALLLKRMKNPKQEITQTVLKPVLHVRQ